MKSWGANVAVKIKRLLALSCNITLFSTGAQRIYILHFFPCSSFLLNKAKESRTLVFYAPFWPLCTHSRLEESVQTPSNTSLRSVKLVVVV